MSVMECLQCGCSDDERFVGKGGEWNGCRALLDISRRHMYSLADVDEEFQRMTDERRANLQGCLQRMKLAGAKSKVGVSCWGEAARLTVGIRRSPAMNLPSETLMTDYMVRANASDSKSSPATSKKRSKPTPAKKKKTKSTPPKKNSKTTTDDDVHAAARLAVLAKLLESPRGDVDYSKILSHFK